MVRSSRWLSLTCLLALMAVLVTPVLGAAPPRTGSAANKKPLTPAQAEAQQHVAAAATALRTGDADSAVRELRTAQALAPTADILIDLSRALVLSGDVMGGRDALKSALEDYRKDIGAKRPELEMELTRVEGKVAKVRLVVGEAGASVSLDHRAVGTTPLDAPVEMNPGIHVFSLTKAGFVALTRETNVAPGPSELTLELVREKATGKLIVIATGSEPLELVLNDKPMGPLPFEGDVEPGFYKLTTTGKSARTELQTVHVVVGQVLNVTLVAALAPADARIAAGDADAAIFLDDRWVAKGEWHGPLPPGQHQLRVERSGYEPYRQALDVKPGERVVLDQLNYVPLPQGADPAAAYSGIFANISLMGLFGPASTNTIAQDCPATATGGECSSTAPAGGGLAFRMGYSLDFIAFEGLLLGSADVSTAEQTFEFSTSPGTSEYYGVPRTEDYAFVHWGFGVGAGVRATTHDPFFRVSGGIDGLLMWRTQQYARATTANTTIPDALETNSSPSSYVNPGFMTDIGILLGSTPGAKFTIGLLMLAEFPPDPVTTPPRKGHLGRDLTSGTQEPYGTPAIDLSRGPRLLVGPFLGGQFGH